MSVTRKYEVEVWHQGTTLLGEIGRMLNSFSWVETRNGVGGIDFNIDESALKEYCDSIGEDAKTFLQLKNTDIKIKRYGSYRTAGFVNDFPDPNYNQSNSTVSIAADGYLNLLADQIVQNPSFSQVETTDIAWNIVNGVSSRAGSTLGITKDSTNWFATGVLRDRTYDNQQYVKDLLVNLTSLGDGSKDFDFRFTPMRKMQTFDYNSPTIHDVTIQYPAPTKPNKGVGATSMTLRVASEMVNKVIAKGSGQGSATLVAEYQDDTSIAQYGIHEAVVLFSDISDTTILMQKAQAIVAAKKDPIVLPVVNVNGATFDISLIHAGDVIKVINTKSPWFPIDAYFRIEEIKVSIDKNSNEDIELILSAYSG